MTRLLVTGGCGFMGSHFVRRWLLEHGDDTIHNVDCLTYAGALENLEDAAVDARHQHHPVDIADPVAMDRVLAEPVDVIVHFAAETHVDRSLEDAGRFVRTNVLGMQTILAGVVRHYPSPERRPSVIVMSTDEVYGPTPKGQLFGVGEPLRPTNPYAASKAAADWMAMSYRRSFDVDVTLVRSVNVYGPRQYPEKFMPLFVARAVAGEPMPLYGDGRHRRSWLYIDDFVDGMMRIVDNPEARSERPVWHLGSTDEKQNREVAQAICRELAADDGLITPVPDRPGHDRRYALDFSQTTRAFGWAPHTTFENGLRATVTWYRENATWCRDRLNWKPAFITDGTHS